MTSQITFSRNGFLVICGITLAAFVVVVGLAMSGAFCDPPVSIPGRQAVVATHLTANDALPLFVNEDGSPEIPSQIFDVMLVSKPFIAIPDIDDAYYSTRRGLVLHIHRNAINKISGVSLIGFYGKQEDLGANPVTLDTVWLAILSVSFQQLCAGLDRPNQAAIETWCEQMVTREFEHNTTNIGKFTLSIRNVRFNENGHMVICKVTRNAK